MEQWKKSLVFWLMIVVSVVLPSVADAQVKVKKTAWKAQIVAGTTVVGTASIIRRATCTVDPSTGSCGNLAIEFTYQVITRVCATTPCTPPYPITKAAFTGPTWIRELCEGDTCAYDENGDLDIGGDFPAPPAGLGEQLDQGLVQVRLNDGTAGVGTFVKFLNVVQ
jgi:hypothetical protein